MEVAASPAPKRILYVITKSSWGGAQRYVYDLAAAAARAGHEVLVAAGGEGELIRRLKKAGIETHSVAGLARDVRLAGELAAYRDLRALMERWKPDVVHLNSSKAGVAALAARRARVPRVIFTVHGWAWNERRPLWQRAFIALAYWLTLLLCDRAITVSEAARRQARFLPLAAKKFVTVHNGVEPVAVAGRADARTELGVSPAALAIGTIAELHPTKNLDVLIRAYRRFRSGFPGSELVIMGEGQERASLEALAGGDADIHLSGHVPNAPSLLRALDIFALPSRSEGLGYALLEAGAASLPVIATDVGGIPEIIEDGETGLLVPAGDAAALAEALRKLADDAQLRGALGSALCEKVAREFSLSRMIERTLALY